MHQNAPYSAQKSNNFSGEGRSSAGSGIHPLHISPHRRRWTFPVADLGGQGGHAPQTPEVTLCPDELFFYYSFTVANDVNLYLLSIQYAAHIIVNSFEFNPISQFQVLLTVSEACLQYMADLRGFYYQKCHKVAYMSYAL